MTQAIGNFNKLLLVLLFLIILAVVELFVITSRFSLLPDSYYYVYEHSIIDVVASGHLGALRWTFDNFASSPGTIVLNCFLGLISGLGVLHTSFMEGLLITLLLLLFAFIWLRSMYGDLDYMIGVTSIFSAGFTAVFYFMFTYATHAYLILILIMTFPLSRMLKARSLRIEDTIMLVISTFSMVVVYLPMGIFMVAPVSLLLFFLAVLRVNLKYIKLFTILSFTIISIYYVYMGQFFFSDFNAFIHSIVENIRFEQLQYAQRVVATRIKYDLVYSLIYPLSLLRFTLVFLIILYSLFTLFTKRRTERPHQVIAFNLLGSLLYIAGVAIYVLVSSLSDYGTRIITISYACYLTTVYSALLYTKYNREKGSKQFSIFRVAVALFAVLSALGAILTPIAQIYYGVKGFDWSTQYNYGEEGLWTSTFINNMMDQSLLNKISGTYRYIYLFSRYGIPYTIFNSRTNISSVANSDSLVVIPTGIMEKPDAEFGPIPCGDFLKLVFAKNIVLNTGLSVVFK
jgi:hypothetical protein